MFVRNDPPAPGVPGELSMTTIHITCGECVATALDAALRDAGRGGRVIALHDDLTVGPLRHADESAHDRIAFWQHAGGPAEAVLRGEAAMLDALERGDAPVVVWHTPDAADQLALRRVCYRLRNVPQRLNEVRLSPDDAAYAHPAAQLAVLPTAQSQPAIRPGAQSVVHPATRLAVELSARLATRVAHAAPISVLRITRLALEWQEARYANGETRRWRDNTFTSGTFAELDALIVDIADAAHGAWLSPAQIGAALPLAGAGIAVGEPVVAWRLRELAENNCLRVRDDLHAACPPGGANARPARNGAPGDSAPSAAHLSLPR